MLNKITKINSTEVVYEMLSAEGKLTNKKQSFNIMPLEATDEDFYELANAIGKLLVSEPKEILKNNVVILMEA